MGRVLVAGPVETARCGIRAVLEAHGYRVTETPGAADSLALASGGDFDLVTLDSRIDEDLYGFCRAVRSQSEVGMIVIVRDGCAQTPIDVLNAGADDYVPDRWVSIELPARVRAVLRRVMRLTKRPHRISLADRVIDLNSHKVRGPRENVAHLTPKECSVLQYLASRYGETVGNRELAQAVWNRGGSDDFEYLRTVIVQIRKKIEIDCRNPQFLLTERAVGYRLLSSPEHSGIANR
jgi:two-component system KDP operon response regulator KdpE